MNENESEKVTEVTPVGEAPEGARPATEDDLDEMTGGLNLVNRATCSSSTGSMNTVVSIGTV